MVKIQSDEVETICFSQQEFKKLLLSYAEDKNRKIEFKTQKGQSVFISFNEDKNENSRARR